MSSRAYIDGLGKSAGKVNATPTDGAMLLQLPPGMIEPDPSQPRKTFDEQKLAELAESIRRHGQLQPVRIRRAETGAKYVIVAGERRWRACTMLGLDRIDALLIPEQAEGDSVWEAQLVENLQRDDVPPLEAATAYREAIDRLGCSQAELARRLGVATSTISRALKLLEAPAETRARIAAGESVRQAVGPKPRRPRVVKADKRRAVELELRSGVVRLKRGATVEQLVEELQAIGREQADAA